MLVTAFHVAVADFVVVVGGDEVVGEITKVTGTVLVYQVPTLMVMVALYVPAPLPLVLTATVRFLLLVMEVLVGDTVSQDLSSEAVSVALLE